VLHFAEVSLGAGRGVRCRRCHGTADAPTFLDASVLVDRITEAAAGTVAPGPNVALTGPEPFDHPDLPALVTAAVRSGVARLRIDTDGAALANPANAGGSIAAGVRHIRVTLLGGSPGTHDVLCGTPGAFEAALAGMRTYARAAEEQDTAVSLSVLVPVCRHTVRDLPTAVAAAGEAGARSVLLRVDDGGADLRAALPWMTAACDTGVVNGVWVELEGVAHCMAPAYVLHLADTYRSRAGVYGPRCAGCPLVASCAGGPVGASADVLASLSAPDGAAALAGRMSVVRGAES
jgi:hypothetical protein